MFKAFGKSRKIVYGAGIPLAAAAFALSWFFLNSHVASVPLRLLVSALIAVIAFSLALMYGRVVAAGEYQKLLLPLYEDLDPEAMLKALDTLDADKLGEGERIMCTVHRANGLMYLGKIDEAESLLGSIRVSEADLNNRYLIEGALATCALLSGDMKEARECITHLKAIARAKKCSKDLSLRVRRVIGYVQYCVAIRTGRSVDIETMVKDFESSRVPTHKLDAAYYLAIYMSRNHDERLGQYIDYIDEKGSRTIYSRLIKKL